MSPPPKDKRNEIAGVEHGQDRERAEREREQHEQSIGAINALTNQLKANQERQDTGESKHASREKLTISLVFFTLIATFIGDGIFYCTMRDARTAAIQAHSDEDMTASNASISSADALNQAISTADADQVNTNQALADSRGANGIAQDTAKRDLRAYIGVRFPDDPTAFQPRVPGLYRLAIPIENEGRTPAYTLTTLSAGRVAGVGVKGLPLAGPDVTSQTLSSTLYPGPASASSIWVPLRTPTSEEKDGFNSGREKIYFFGTIKYVDAYRTRHFTNFCYSLDVLGELKECSWGHESN